MEQEKSNQESDSEETQSPERKDVNVTPEPAAAGAGVQGGTAEGEENK